MKGKQAPGDGCVFWSLQRAADVPDDDAWLTPRERDVLKTLKFPKRRQDWRLGRWTGKRCVMRALGLASSPGEVAIVAADDGAPEARDAETGKALPVTMSLSHSADYAIATAGERDVVLGCDIEAVASRSAAFVQDYFTEGERQAVSAAGDAAALVTNAIWGGKESTLKALRTGLRRDTRSVEVRLEHATGSPGTWQRLVATDHAGACTFSGWWKTVDAMVVTVVCDPPSVPPPHDPQ